MLKVMFGAALAVGMITAPMPGFVSTAAAQQQARPRPTKPQMERERARAARSRAAKKCAVEWKEAKAASKVEKEEQHGAKLSERLQQTSQVGIELARRKNFPARMNNKLKKLGFEKLRGRRRDLKSRRRPLVSSGTGAPRRDRIARITA